MIRSARIGLAAVAVALLWSGTCTALAGTDPTAPSNYRLDEGSAYTSGCFGPCVCPAISAAMRGTFLLTPAGSDPLFTTYQVTEVRWSVALGEPDLHITGSGTYRIGGEFALQQQLSLDLLVGDQPARHFDSGLVTGSAPFPGISVTLSLNGEACFDTVLAVNAAPMPSREIRPDRIPGGIAPRSGRRGP
jgi:hypothetical protein